MARGRFVSYSNKDKPVAERLWLGLRIKGSVVGLPPISPGKFLGRCHYQCRDLGHQFMVIILSGNFQPVETIVLEIEGADRDRCLLIPFRIEMMTPRVRWPISSPPNIGWMPSHHL